MPTRSTLAVLVCIATAWGGDCGSTTPAGPVPVGLVARTAADLAKPGLKRQERVAALHNFVRDEIRQVKTEYS